jgi:CRISPR system Cascade subunit CasD
VFLAAVEADASLLEGLQEALRRPHFPLYLGRRSCSPIGRLEQGLRDGTAVEALIHEPWHASPWFRRTCPDARVLLDLVADCAPGDPRAELVRDEPLSFDPHYRQWEWRAVLRHEPVSVPNPDYVDRHQPLGVL